MNRTLLRALRKIALVTLAAGAAGPLLAAPAAPAPAVSALPSDSVYQLPVMLTDQQGRKLALSGHRGQPMLVSMFYTNCDFTCPMLVEAVTQTRAKLSADERERLSVLLVSLDPERDTVAVLKHTSEQRQLDPSHWTLARTDAKSVRQLAAVLGIQYRAMPNGDFNHTTALILLDADGRVVARTTRLGDADPAFVKQVSAALRSAVR